MRIVFMGTPAFAIPSLQLLIQSHHQLVGIVTNPDKPAGRGNKIIASPVKRFGEEQDIPVLQPTDFLDQGFLSQLKAINADLFLVVAFKILPAEVFELPPRGTVNLHASLLPKYRGAAPINWALINGEKETGVTTFFIEKNVDTGEILLQEKVSVGEDMTAGELHDLLAEVGARVLLKTADGLESGELVAIKQSGEVTRAPKLTKELGAVDWSKPAGSIHNLIRGLSPVPSAFTHYQGTYLKLLRSALARDIDNRDAEPGTIVAVPKNGPLAIQTGHGVLNILQLQPQGKKVLTAGEFIRGYRIQVGEKFDTVKPDK